MLVLYNAALMQITDIVIAYVNMLRTLLDNSCADDTQGSLVVAADWWRCAVTVAVTVAVGVVPKLNRPSSVS